MSQSGRTPVIIGVGDVVNRSRKVDDAIEPMHLMINAIQSALQDTGISPSSIATLQSEIDSLDIVRTWTWPYPDLPSLMSAQLGIRPIHRHCSEHGGNQPCKLLDDAARRVSSGESKVAVVTGGEAMASLSACVTAKKLPPPGWTKLDEEVKSGFSPTTRELKPDLGATHHIGNPIHIYPLYENSFRAYRGQSISDNYAESADMYAEFAKVAGKNRHSWSYGRPAETKESIETVSKKNRMICLPYPLLMNAFNTVNLAAACIITSTSHARELGIPSHKWIYPLGGAGTRDSSNFWERPSYWWSPSISRSLDAGMEVAGLEKDDIDLYDFYSCFPIVPKLACHHLGLPFSRTSKPITLLGGLTSFGGAGNNYSMHAITEMVRRLRSNDGKIGLVLGNGGCVTYQAVVCLSKSPRRDGLPYPSVNPLPPIITDVYIPPVEDRAEGDAWVETYTVEFNRDGSALRGHVVGRLKSNGHRFIANHADDQTLRQLCSNDIEPISRSGKVKTSADNRNLFTLHSEVAKL